MRDDRQHRGRLGPNEVFQTFQEFRDIDGDYLMRGIDGDDFMAGTRVPRPRKPNQDAGAIALPEPDEDEHDL